MKKVLLDSDPGLDDALAILLALGSRGALDVEAIVSTFGNVSLDSTKNNLLRILSFFDRTKAAFPVLGAGSRGPMNGRAPQARHVHGHDGLADLARMCPLMPGRRASRFANGVDLIMESVLSKGVDTIIATGPLTDLARAIKKDRRFLKKLDEIIIMGGAVFVKGNVTSCSEFNFHCDPEAAGIVLNAHVRKRLVSLDVTHRALLMRAHLEPVRKLDTPLCGFICCISEYLIMSNIKRGLSGAPMHDPLAAGIAIDEGICGYRPLCLDVMTKGPQRGQVIVKNGRPNTLFCKTVDTERFFKLFIGTLVKISRRLSHEIKRSV